MESSLLYIALLLVALGISYYSWHKEHDRKDLYYIWIYGVGILAIAWQTAALDPHHLFGLVWLAEAVAWVVVTIKYYRKKRR